jgi:uncharacterized membrane protein
VITFPLSINTNGVIAEYQVNGRAELVFIYNAGVYTTIAFPGATNTVADSINDRGQITGYWENTTAKYAFVYINGQYTTIAPPGGSTPLAFSINKSGQIVGCYSTVANHGFLADPAGK